MSHRGRCLMYKWLFTAGKSSVMLQGMIEGELIKDVQKCQR